MIFKPFHVQVNIMKHKIKIESIFIRIWEGNLSSRVFVFLCKKHHNPAATNFNRLCFIRLNSLEQKSMAVSFVTQVCLRDLD